MFYAYKVKFDLVVQEINLRVERRSVHTRSMGLVRGDEHLCENRP